MGEYVGKGDWTEAFLNVLPKRKGATSVEIAPEIKNESSKWINRCCIQ